MDRIENGRSTGVWASDLAENSPLVLARWGPRGKRRAMTSATCMPGERPVPLSERERRADRLGELLERIAELRVEAALQGAPRLTGEEIAAMALAVADAEGLDAVSIRRVASELGVGTMTLYSYVRPRTS